MEVANIATLNIGDQVAITIKSIDEMGLLVTMDAYQHEAFVSLSEAYKRVNGARPKRKVGDQCMATIIRMDNQRGFFDLSL